MLHYDAVKPLTVLLIKQISIEPAVLMINPLLMVENAGSKTENEVILYLTDILSEHLVPLSLLFPVRETKHLPSYPT